MQKVSNQIKQSSEPLGRTLTEVPSESDTKFADLNDDCKLLILEELDFPSLINMAEANPHFFHLAADVYRRKFGSKEIEIIEPSPGDKPMKESNGKIQILNFVLTEKLLQNFGKFITKLKINSWIINFEMFRWILEQANEHCTALTKLELITFDENALVNVHAPFANVEIVSFRESLTKLIVKDFKLNEMFPKLRALSLPFSHAIDRDSILLEFPNLRHLSASFLKTKGTNEMDVQSMIKLNPQIRNLSVCYITMEFLKFVSETLPDLENLEIVWLKEGAEYNGQIHLKNVRNLNVTSAIDNFPRSVTVEQLEEFTIDWGHTSSPGAWIDFINRHTTLTKLNIIDDEIDDSKLSMLARGITNLVEATFAISSDIRPESIITFLEAGVNLNRIEMSFAEPIPEDELMILQSCIEKPWKLTNTSSSYLIEKEF